MMEEKLGFFDVLKKALTIPYKKPQFIFFTFLTSLPLFCFMLMYETLFQRTLVSTAKILSEQNLLTCYGCIYSTELEFFERLIDQVSHEFILLGVFYLGILHFLDLITTIATVDLASIIYSEENITMNLKNMLQRFISETRLKGPLITSIYTLLLATLFLSGLIYMVTCIYTAVGRFAFIIVLCGVIFIALSAKYIELCVIWNMGVVISILEEKQGDVALVLSSYISRGRRQSGFLFLIFFSLWNLGLRLSCMYLGWNEGGSGLGVIAALVSFMCLGNIVKWLCFVVYFYDCRKLARERMIDVEASNAIQE